MDAATQTFFELLDAAGGDLGMVFDYLTSFFGSETLAEQAIINEDLAIN